MGLWDAMARLLRLFRTFSNWETPWEKVHLVRYTVRQIGYPRFSDGRADDGLVQGALNWATGETVAIKEIQLGNIPKGEIGQIMVCGSRARDDTKVLMGALTSLRLTSSRISTYVLLKPIQRVPMPDRLAPKHSQV